MLTSTEVQNLDLNLLRVFKAILQTRSISRAALAVGLTQPAASNALRRLRDSVKDELFTLTPEGMLPTVFAESFAQAVIPALHAIDHSLMQVASFDPSSCKQTMRLGVTDYAVSTTMRGLLTQLVTLAPMAQFHQVVMRDRNPHEDLRQGKLDIAIGAFTDEASGFYQKTLHEETFTTIFRKSHPVLRAGKVSLDKYASARHLLIAPWGQAWGAVDDALAKKKLSRSIALTVPYFSAVPEIIASTDLVSTVPTGLAREWSKEFGIGCCEPPLVLPSFKISLLWHSRTHKSASHQWLRRQFTISD